MKIIKRYDQHRRDFNADMECESCKAVDKKVSCYDDSYFHESVIPKMKCKSCGESTLSLGLKPQEVATRYPDNFTV